MTTGMDVTLTTIAEVENMVRGFHELLEDRRDALGVIYRAQNALERIEERLNAGTAHRPVDNVRECRRIAAEELEAIQGFWANSIAAHS